MSGESCPAPLVLLMEDSLGALNRLVSTLRARQLVLDSLTVSKTGRAGEQQVVLQIGGTARVDQVVAWLRKMEEVKSVEVG